jgi:DNA repair exonuclease SbcCD ATPase subunit
MFKIITRVSIGLSLALSIAALVMAVQLFQQRETLKGRTQKLEGAVHKVAATLEVKGGTNAMLTIPDDQLKTFKQVPGGPQTMDAPLNQLVLAAQEQLITLNNTRTELADTKVTLAKTQDELKETQTQLASAKDKIKEQEGVIEAKNTIISEKETAIRNLETEKSELMTKVEVVNSQLLELQVENEELIDKNDVIEARLVDYEARLFPELAKKAIPKGHQGTVTYVNPDWNFLIVKLAPTSVKSTIPDLEFMIYRLDKLVGKVRVQSVVDNLAVAEILPDWQQTVPQNGDGILY